MAYIGRQLVRGQNRIYDDISSSFNGSTTAFNLTIGGDATPPAQVNQLWIILGGILQKPGTDFTVADAQVTFTTAPAAGLDFWAMIQGDTSDMNAPSDGSVTPTKIATSGDFAFPADVRFKDADGSHYVGLQAPTTVSSNLVWTLPAADGGANQVLKTNGSGVLGWASDANAPEGTAVLSTGVTGTTKYLRVDGDNTCSWQLAVDATKMPLAGGSFTGDVIFTGDAANLTWDKSADDLIFNDNAKAAFGTGSDFQIYYDSSNTILVGSAGDIYQKSADDMYLRVAGDESGIDIIGDGAVQLYHNNVKTLETTSNGILVGGGILKVQASGEPGLYVGSTNAGGAALYLDGDSNGDWIGADYSWLRHRNDGHLEICCDNPSNASSFYLKVKDGTAPAIDAITAAGVKLYYDGNLKFETSSTGSKVSGRLDVDGDLISHSANNNSLGLTGHRWNDLFIANDIDINDDGKILLGTGDDLQIFHQASNNVSYIQQTVSAQHLIIKNTNADATGKIYIEPRHGQSAVMCDGATGEVELRYGGNMKMETNANGISVDGNIGFVSAGQGIDFGATGNSSGTMSSELLDDYEEGTWTPAVNNGVSNTQQFDAVGNYTKIGNRVYCQFLLQWSGQGNGNRVQFQGLPFTSVSTNALGGGTCVWTNVTGLTEWSAIQLIAKRDDTIIECYRDGNNNATTGDSFTNKAFYGVLEYMA